MTSTSCFWRSTGLNTLIIMPFHENFDSSIINKMIFIIVVEPKFREKHYYPNSNILLFIFTATLPQLEFLDGTPIEKSKRIQAVQDLDHIKLMIHSGLRIEKIVQ